MRLLLDTHLLIWASRDEVRLSSAARMYLQQAENELFFSVISIWEIAIKHGLQRHSFYIEPKMMRTRLLESGYQEVLLTGGHAVGVASLPPIHKDPFDRILMAQAMIEGLTLLTSDATVASYPGPILKV